MLRGVLNIFPVDLVAEEVRRILLSLAPLTADRAVVLVGGQAVAVWTN